MSRWLDAASPSLPVNRGEFALQHPLAARLLAQRGLRDGDAVRTFLDPDHYQPSSPFDLPGMQAGVDHLIKAIHDGERIGVWGDFDVDGLTATAILVDALRMAGADVLYHIPVRARASHGVHRPALDDLIRQGMRLLITCDTGIDAREETAYARSRGVDVIISDHHSLPERLPEALAVIDPHLMAQEHPFSSLPGAGVAYEIVAGLAGRGLAGIHPEDYQDLAALAVVADVAPVLGEARWLLQRGLQRLRKTPRPALQAIYDLIDLDYTQMSEEHIGYLLAPRINAVGRLDDSASLVEFFISQDEKFIEPIALQMEALNARRRYLSQEVYDGALAIIAREPALLQAPVLVLSHPAWQAGVIGVVAGRLVHTYGRPAVLISIDPQTGLGRGSARSIAGVDIAAAIGRQSHLLNNYGGHPAAAGLSLPSSNIDDFRRGLARTVGEMLGGRDLAATLTIDGYFTLSDINLALAEEVEMLAPFGNGNPAPVFASPHLNLQTVTSIGRGQEHLKLSVEDGRGNLQDVFWWQGAGQPLPHESFDLAFTLRASTFQGRRAVQLAWVEARLSETSRIEIAETRRLPFEIVDMRSQSDPAAALKNLLAEASADIQVWCEGQTCPIPPPSRGICRSRATLQGGKSLIIWNAPPARDVLNAAIERVKPQCIFLFACTEKSPGAPDFLRQLAGFIKNALHANAGRLSIFRLAALTGQNEAAVRLGIAWLAAHGDINLVTLEPSREDEIVVSLAGERASDDAAAARHLQRLKAALAESAAYRDYFGRADPGLLF